MPESVLPEVRGNADGFSTTDVLGAPVPIAGMAGDQQAATLGQGCVRASDVKSTYGTGCFLLAHTGPEPVASRHRLLMGAFRIEIEGPTDSDTDALKRMGCIAEIVSWRTRLRISQAPWMTDLSRRVQHYGYQYNYRGPNNGRHDPAPPFPRWAEVIGARLAPYFDDRQPEQCIVNEYRPGQGIGNRFAWDEDEALAGIEQTVHTLIQSVAPDGTQLADEREPLLWGFANRRPAAPARRPRSSSPSCRCAAGAAAARRGARPLSKHPGARFEVVRCLRGRVCGFPGRRSRDGHPSRQSCAGSIRWRVWFRRALRRPPPCA